MDTNLLLSIIVKVSAAGFIVDRLASGVPNLGQQLLPLAGLLALVAAVLFIFELPRLERAATLVTETAAKPTSMAFDVRHSAGPR